ncbi:hypothetical protein COCNU_04G015510 [Cocos nucifera]|uniref:protein-serine/threonine phosphatase n=1 Tax=Cocos nucifera TaxID=13894 RepID=A0A8K0N0P4_COCNU|nr:hypothetical protein COCNU_04G015510 [Cocos nucifera]
MVHTCSRKEGELSECLKKWEAEGLRVTGSVCDLSVPDRREDLMRKVSSLFDGKLNILVAVSCKDRMHEMVAEELERVRWCPPPPAEEWREVMERSFCRMDEAVVRWWGGPRNASCRCEMQTPRSEHVGSTAVVAVVGPNRIVVANCGDSRAILCRNGIPIPLSSDHKPDRPDELERIQAAGGRVIYWDGARVLGVLAMSRAIGDRYLKPYVMAEPEVTVTEREEGDECLILASDGLWDVVTNKMACDIARMCLSAPPADGESGSNRACSDAAMLLTKLALARQSADNLQSEAQSWEFAGKAGKKKKTLHFFIESMNRASKWGRARELSLHDIAKGRRQVEEVRKEVERLKEALDKMVAERDEKLLVVAAKVAKVKQEATAKVAKAKQRAKAKRVVEEQLVNAHWLAMKALEDFVRERALAVEEYRMSMELHKEKMAFNQEAFNFGYEEGFDDYRRQVAARFLKADLFFLDGLVKREGVEAEVSPPESISMEA